MAFVLQIDESVEFRVRKKDGSIIDAILRVKEFILTPFTTNEISRAIRRALYKR